MGAGMPPCRRARCRVHYSADENVGALDKTCADVIRGKMHGRARLRAPLLPLETSAMAVENQTPGRLKIYI